LSLVRKDVDHLINFVDRQIYIDTNIKLYQRKRGREEERKRGREEERKRGREEERKRGRRILDIVIFQTDITK